jgi:hypothetical protein
MWHGYALILSGKPDSQQTRFTFLAAKDLAPEGNPVIAAALASNPPVSFLHR